MKKSGVVFYFVLYFKASILIGSDTIQNPIHVAVKPQYGLILAHSSKIEHLTYTNPFGLEAELSWLRIKDKNYQQCNCYSKAGFSLLYINYANPGIVGSSYSLIGFAEPFLVRKINFKLSVRMGIGLSYLDHVYDEISNPDNLFFSTHVALITHIDLNAYYKLNENLSLMVYAKYNHISNGGTKSPNYGMNFPTFGLGLNYSPQRSFVFPEFERQEFIPMWFYYLNSFGTVKTIEKDDTNPEKSTIVFGFSGLVGRKVTKLNGFSMGAEYINDGFAKEKIERQDLNSDHQQVSFLIGHHLLFGRFDFSQQWGTYIYAPYKIRAFYQRYTLTYRFSKHLFTGATLKVHGDWADNFNLVVGYSF
jgi:hypothetical protein